MVEEISRRRAGGGQQPVRRRKKIGERGEDLRFSDGNRMTVFRRRQIGVQHAGADRTEEVSRCDGEDCRMELVRSALADRKTGMGTAAGRMMDKGVQEETAAQQQDQKKRPDLSQ